MIRPPQGGGRGKELGHILSRIADDGLFPIDDVLVVQSDKGPVHPGQCYNHAVEMPVTENTEQQLNEVQLLI